MALVPAGCFHMGSEYAGIEERPVHRVCFEQPFFIDVTEVTNRQYGSAGNFSGDDRPREDVNWQEARRTARRGGRGCPLKPSGSTRRAARMAWCTRGAMSRPAATRRTTRQRRRGRQHTGRRIVGGRPRPERQCVGMGERLVRRGLLPATGGWRGEPAGAGCRSVAACCGRLVALFYKLPARCLPLRALPALQERYSGFRCARSC